MRVLIGFAIVSCVGQLHADIVVTVSGNQGSSIVDVSASGTFTETASDDDLGVGAGWSGSNGGDFAGSEFNNELGLEGINRALDIEGDLAVTTATGEVFDLSFGFDDDGTTDTDDFALFLTDGGFFDFDGLEWTLSGTSTGDLASLGGLADGFSPTFDDLNEGTYTNFLPNGDGITLIIQAKSIPEPTAIGILSLGLCAALRRNRQ